MKKRLLLLPLLAGFALTGCTITLFGKEITIGKDDSKKGQIPDIPNTPVTPPKDIPIMEEYGNYKLAESVVAGKRYLLGSKRTIDVHEGEIRFFNGNYHVGDDPDDAKSYGKRYSHYLGTTAAQNGDLSFAAELEAIDAGNGMFHFKVHTTEENPWNEKYLGVYPSKGYSNNVLSFCLLDTPESKTFTSVDDFKYASSGGSIEVTSQVVISSFKYYTTYGDDARPIKTIGFEFQHTDAGDVSPVGKFFGTQGQYSSFDCKSYDTAMDPDVYDLAHLYEPKLAE